jgi:predicted nucleic acid-binding protein
VTRLVVDASVALKWFLPEPLGDAALSLLDEEVTLLAPGLLAIEVANALWKRHRRHQLEASEARRILADLARAPLEIHRTERWTAVALDLALQYGVTAYDGLYLALAAGHRCRLVTADRRLYEICHRGEISQWLIWLGDPLHRHR